MTDIHKIAEITGLSVRALRRLDKHGFLKVTKSTDPVADAIRANLKKGNRLTALQQYHLLKNPKLRETLDQWDYEIDQILREQGDALDNGAPWSISSAIDLASRKDKSAVEKIARWLAEFIQRDSGFDNCVARDHAYLAVRLLANIPEHQLDFLAGKIPACIWQCRNHEIMREFWRVEDGRTIYFRPVKKTLVGLDL